MGLVVLGIAIPLSFLMALLAIPIELAFSIERINNIHGRVTVRWLFGLARFRIGIPGSKRRKRQHAAKKPAPAKTPRKNPKNTASSKIVAALKQPAFRQRSQQFINDLLRATHSHNLYFHLRIGLGDPADTGRLWILLGPVATMAARIRSAVVRIEPEFMDAVFEFHSHGRFRLTPLEFIVLATAFVLSPATLRAWHTSR